MSRLLVNNIYFTVSEQNSLSWRIAEVLDISLFVVF